MVRIGLPLLVAALVLASPARAAEASCDSSLKQLQAKLEVLQKENAELKKQVANAGTQQNEVPYFSTEAIVDSLGSVSDFAFSQSNFDTMDLKSVYSARDASYEAFQAASVHATAAASKGLAAATEAMFSAAEMAQDLHGKHVSQHTREYYDTTLETYAEHVEPHVSLAKKAYYANVHPHVDKASESISAGVGAAMEGGRTLTPKLWSVVEMAIAAVSEASSGAAGKQMAFLVEAKTFTVMGRFFRFNHGFLDIALAVMQGLIALYLGFTILWRLCLSTLVWKIGVQLLGRKVFLGITQKMVKLCFRVTMGILAISFTLVLTLMAISFSWLLLVLCGGLGVALLHAVEKGLTVGLKPGMRLGLGVGVGLLFYVICRFTCCKRKAKEPRKSTNGKSSAKSEPKKAGGDAKQASKPTKKK